MSIDLEDFECAVADRFPAAFSCHLPAVVATPGELVSQLEAQATSTGEGALLLARAFYRIRAALAQAADIPALSITPRTRLVELFPDVKNRRRMWEAFHSALAIPYAPRLSRSNVVAWAITLVVGVSFLVAISLTASLSPVTWPIIPVGALTAVGVLWALLRITIPLARYFEPCELTAGDLAHYAVAYGAPFLDAEYPALTRLQIIEVVQALVRLEIGAPHMRLDMTWRELAVAARAR